ncbi:hypothetical protein DPEC_G00314990 [Dallia pectoralis]|uniref:Uncharacterized protein n=1 Tax=Dallia pectoralis TaxID=75939 RepID=A0ACC2FCI8_DALPE|nr:hypothetical protein DPEC_G00314990 [Dallia pectoralis]
MPVGLVTNWYLQKHCEVLAVPGNRSRASTVCTFSPTPIYIAGQILNLVKYLAQSVSSVLQCRPGIWPDTRLTALEQTTAGQNKELRFRSVVLCCWALFKRNWVSRSAHKQPFNMELVALPWKPRLYRHPSVPFACSRLGLLPRLAPSLYGLHQKPHYPPCHQAGEHGGGRHPPRMGLIAAEEPWERVLNQMKEVDQGDSTGLISEVVGKYDHWTTPGHTMMVTMITTKTAEVNRNLLHRDSCSPVSPHLTPTPDSTVREGGPQKRLAQAQD